MTSKALKDRLAALEATYGVSDGPATDESHTYAPGMKRFKEALDEAMAASGFKKKVNPPQRPGEGRLAYAFRCAIGRDFPDITESADDAPPDC
jgi:hypothetical protein